MEILTRECVRVGLRKKKRDRQNLQCDVVDEYHCFQRPRSSLKAQKSIQNHRKATNMVKAPGTHANFGA